MGVRTPFQCAPDGCNEGREVHHLFFRGRERSAMPHHAECKVTLEADLVASTCRCCHPLLHKVACLSGQRSRASCGTGIAMGRARGASCRNLVTCERDKAAAILLLVPGTCDILIASCLLPLSGTIAVKDL